MPEPKMNEDDFRTLCDAHLDGTLTPEQHGLLSDTLRDDPVLRRSFVEYCQLDAGLKLGSRASTLERLPEELADELANAAESNIVEFPAARGFGFREWALAAAACIAFLFAGLWVGPRLNGSAKQAGVGWISETRDCQWGDASFPTVKGSRLQPGELFLAAGHATLKFDSGAEVTLEGPAQFEVFDEMHCAIRKGTLTADVPPSAIGFTVTTPHGDVVDFGTKFGISANPGGKSGVQVIEGKVELRHTATGNTLELHQGEKAIYDASSSQSLRDDAEAELLSAARRVAAEPLVQITTASGKGRAAYVCSPGSTNNVSDTLLLLKNSRNTQYHRKAYLGFELGALKPGRVKSASLSLAFEPTGFGFASRQPDSIFEVYGLIEDDLNAWDEQTLDWANAPANIDDGATIDTTKAQLLGTFEVSQTERSVMRQIKGEALARFLNSRTAGYTTLIVVRATRESWAGGLVHGFAGNNHPTAPPPTLRLVLEEAAN